MRSRIVVTAAVATATLAFAAPAAAQPPANPDCQGERAGHGGAAAITQAGLAAFPAPGFSEFAPGGVAAFNQAVICAPRNN